jgi:hypothetical protein
MCFCDLFPENILMLTSDPQRLRHLFYFSNSQHHPPQVALWGHLLETRNSFRPFSRLSNELSYIIEANHLALINRSIAKFSTLKLNHTCPTRTLSALSINHRILHTCYLHYFWHLFMWGRVGHFLFVQLLSSSFIVRNSHNRILHESFSSARPAPSNALVFDIVRCCSHRCAGSRDSDFQNQWWYLDLKRCHSTR